MGIEVNPLRRPLTPPEQLLVTTVADVQAERGQWPTYQWVEAVLGRNGYDADLVLAGLPTVGQYGSCWWNRQGGMADPAGRVGLTIAGMAGHGGRAGTIEQFLKVLRQLCRLRLELVDDPVTATQVVVADHQLQAALSPAVNLAAVRPLLRQEPATWHLSRHADESGRDVGYLLTGGDRVLRRFTSVQTLDDYLDTAIVVLAPAAVVTAPALPATALHTALDLLDMTWRLHRLNDGRALLRLASAKRTARLAETPGSIDELAARLAALTDVLEKLDVPDPDREHALDRLQTAITGRLDPAGTDRVNHAVDLLHQIRQLRNGLTHSGQAPARRTRPPRSSASAGHQPTRPMPGTGSLDTPWPPWMTSATNSTSPAPPPRPAERDAGRRSPGSRSAPRHCRCSGRR